MTIPDISAYMTSIRPYRWLDLHNMLSKTKLKFELVIVGPIEPDFKLPKEIKYYKSNVKPQQCMHTSAMLSTGETLLQIVDDTEYEDYAIEMMFYEVMIGENITATCKYYHCDCDHSKEQNIRGYPYDPYISDNLPLLPVCGLFKRSLYHEMGGLDRRFRGVMGELDLYMRMRVAGYNTVFVNYICNENIKYQHDEKTGLCLKYWTTDRPIFEKLWFNNKGIPWCARNDVLKRYEDKDLLTVEQNYD